MSSFERSHHINFSGNQTFTSANTVINNFHTPAPFSRWLPEGISSNPRNEEQWLTLCGQQRVRVIDMCDINILRQLSSKVVHVVVKHTNPFRDAMFVKIQKRVQSAEILHFGERRFTVIAFEHHDQDEGGVDRIKTALKPLYEAALSQRQVWLPQLFGLGRSTTPTLIYHDELVGGEDILAQYTGAPIVCSYLHCKGNTSYSAIDNEGTLKRLSIPLSGHVRYWTFNRRTSSWQYDITSKVFSGVKNDPPAPIFHDGPGDSLLFSHDYNPLLDSREILRVLPNYLYLISALRLRLYCVEQLTDFVRHGVLTFGALVDRSKPSILAHFPFTPYPKWYLRNTNLDIDAKYSQSVPSRLDLAFMKEMDMLQMNLHFSLKVVPEDRHRLRVACLSQSLSLRDDTVNCSDIVFIDELCFSLVGNFTSNLASHIYLFVPPLRPRWINEIPCLPWPLPSALFYWSFDPEGKTSVAEEDWELYGIPKLKVQTEPFSTWPEWLYEAARDYFRLGNYDMNGERFVYEHGYPILIKEDPHLRIGNTAQIETYRPAVT